MFKNIAEGNDKQTMMNPSLHKAVILTRWPSNQALFNRTTETATLHTRPRQNMSQALYGPSNPQHKSFTHGPK